ncbi:IS3 family transposase [Paenibacillus sp. LHD-38]
MIINWFFKPLRKPLKRKQACREEAQRRIEEYLYFYNNKRPQKK